MSLYEKVMERQSRLMKTIAAAFGADVSESNADKDIIKNSTDIAILQANHPGNIGLGYEFKE